MRNYKKTKFKYTLLFPKVRVKGMSWVFHKGDDDYRPSVPHGHSTDNLYRLQLWTGNIYEAQTGKLKYKAKKKDIKSPAKEKEDPMCRSGMRWRWGVIQ